MLEPYRRAASRYRQPRPARGRGPAADAGGERHLARLGRVERLDGASAISTCGNCGTGRRRPTSTPRAGGLVRYGQACGWSLALGHARSGDRDRDRGHTSGAATSSTKRSRRSPTPMPTRTSATSSGSPRPPKQTRSRSNPGFEGCQTRPHITQQRRTVTMPSAT